MSQGLADVGSRDAFDGAAVARERARYLTRLLIERVTPAQQYSPPMGDRNLQEWISDQLYTLLGKHARSWHMKLVYISALVDLR